MKNRSRRQHPLFPLHAAWGRSVVAPASVLLWLAGCFNGAALAQAVTPIEPTLNVSPTGNGNATAASAPVLYGISGGGPAELGQTVTLTVSVANPATQDLQFQWRKNGTAVPGATANPLVLTSVTAADAGTYSVVVSNAAGESVSATDVTVKAAAPPVIFSHPTASVAYVGQTVTFSFGATGSFPRSYQWRKDGNPIAGATDSTLRIQGVNTSHAGAYSVVVTNAHGSATSNAAALTVNAAIAPVIYAGSPADATTTAGGAVYLSISLSAGSSPLTCVWYKNGAVLPGATDTHLRFEPAATTDTGRYRVTVTNAAGTASSREATVTVNPAVAPTLTSGPSPVSVFPGESAYFGVSVNGTYPFQYQWYKDGVAIAGAVGSSYSVSPVSASHAGSYSVMVRNAAGSVTSAGAILTVKTPVAPTINTHPRDVIAVEGGSATFEIQYSGSPTLAVTWYRNGVPIPDARSSYISVSATRANAGKYHAVVSNSAGSAQSQPATLSLEPRPAPPIVTLYNFNATAGNSVYLSPSLSVAGTPTYQWYRNGIPLPQQTSASLTINAATVNDTGDYFVVITNESGTTTSRTARVTVNTSRTVPPGGWVSAERWGDVIYFAFANPARIERFNLAADSWLTPITLPRPPSAMVVSGHYIVTASGSVIYRYTMEGTEETVLHSGFSANVNGLALARSYVVATATPYYSSSQVKAFRISDGTLTSSVNYTYYWSGSMAGSPNSDRIFSRTNGISPSDIVVTTLSAAGVLAQSPTDSRYHGSYPDATRVILSPSGTLVADDGGTVYHSADLTFAGTLGGPMDDVAFGNNMTVVARGGTLTRLDERFQEVGRAVTATCARIFIYGGDVFAFAHPAPGSGIGKTRVALSSFVSPSPAPRVDATTIGFSPSAMFVDRNGVVGLYSKLDRQIFRWSLAERKYLEPVRLQGWPDAITYSADLHRIYIGYSDSRITQVRLAAGSVTEDRFASLGQPVLGLADAGDFLVAVDRTNSSGSHYVFDHNGTLVTQRNASYGATEPIWNAAQRRLYALTDDGAYFTYTPLSVGGTLEATQLSRYLYDTERRPPLRIAPDGNNLLLGSGKFHDPHTFAVTNSLANRIDDAVWINNRVYSGRRTIAGTEIQRWGGGNYGLDRTVLIKGRLLQLFPIAGGRLLVITTRDGIVYYTTLDQDLAVLTNDAGGPPTRVANLAARAVAGRNAETLIPGFVIAGSEPKRLLIRAAGPALNSLFGVGGALADPRLLVINSAGTTVATNDDWESTASSSELAAVANRVGAFPFPAAGRDAAALVTLNPGAYTVQVVGAGESTGVALVEVYDAQDAGSSSRLVNIAARAQVGTGGDVLIPGIVVQGTSSGTRRLLIRAVGPSLSQFGVEGRLADPRLRLFRGQQLIQENNDWQSDLTAAGEIQRSGSQSGAFALLPGSKDAALLVTLAPGAYTAQVSGADGGTGVALVEVYEVED